MANGIVRRLDDLGRITLPIEIRRRYEINDGDRLGINLEGNTIRISKTVTGMSRAVDELDRVVIPKEYRKTLRFDDCQQVDTWVEDGEICISKYGNGCIICGSVDDLIVTKEFNICRQHAHMVVDAVMEE